MPVSVDKPLTGKQRKFAQAVAVEGKPKAQARRENYAVTPGYEATNRRRASELAQQPNVASEIRRLTWLACPNLDDVHGMRSQAVRVLSDLSRDSASDEVRLKAALALYKIAETSRAAADPRATDTEQDKLLASLRKLYNTIQGTAAEGDGAPDIDIGPQVRPPDDDPIDITCIAAPVEPVAPGE
jgi:hypothetical protein